MGTELTEEQAFQQDLGQVRAGDLAARDRLARIALGLATEVTRTSPPAAVRRMPREDAEELPGKACVRALKRLAHFHGSRTKFRSYLAVVIHNLAKDFWRAQSRLPERVSIDAGPELPDRGAGPDQGDLETVMQLIEAMGQPCRSLIVWRFEKREMKDIIEHLGIETTGRLLETAQREVADLVRVMSRRTLDCLRDLKDRFVAEGG